VCVKEIATQRQAFLRIFAYFRPDWRNSLPFQGAFPPPFGPVAYPPVAKLESSHVRDVALLVLPRRRGIMADQRRRGCSVV